VGLTFLANEYLSVSGKNLLFALMKYPFGGSTNEGYSRFET
jgi:hypothetical protein